MAIIYTLLASYYYIFVICVLSIDLIRDNQDTPDMLLTLGNFKEVNCKIHNNICS
jgi:hypothetical protein